MKKVGDDMWREALHIKQVAQQLAWFMRGSMSYNDILNMSRTELENINKLIDSNLETTKKTKLPFF